VGDCAVGAGVASPEKQLIGDARGDVGGDVGAERGERGGESVCRRCLDSLESTTSVLKNPTRLRVLPCSVESFSFSLGDFPETETWGDEWEERADSKVGLCGL
jgi:hypothetical protein